MACHLLRRRPMELPKIISVDDHVVEPPHVWQTWLPEKFRERGPGCVQAYNDWMVEEWCAPSGGMNIPLSLIPLWDPQLAAEETQRNADRGVRAICFSEMPTRLKLPSIHTGYWDPLWQVCND